MKLKLLYSALILLLLSSCAARTDYTRYLADPALAPGGITLFSVLDAKKKGEPTVSFSGGEVFIVEDDEKGTWGIVATDVEGRTWKVRTLLQERQNKV